LFDALDRPLVLSLDRREECLGGVQVAGPEGLYDGVELLEQVVKAEIADDAFKRVGLAEGLIGVGAGHRFSQVGKSRVIDEFLQEFRKQRLVAREAVHAT